LTVEIEPDGLRLYARGELDEIFSAHLSPEASGTSQSARDSLVAEAAAERQASEAQTGPDLQTSEPQISSSAAETKYNATEEQPSSVDARTNSTTTKPEPSVDTSPLEVSSGDDVQNELDRLRALLKNREELLSIKDSEVQDLKDQRDWLQTRVERLEEKSDRDQILLLSETQTIRKLISMQEQRKSGFRQLLEWVGLLPATPSQAPALSGPTATVKTTPSSMAHPIEIRKAANS